MVLYWMWHPGDQPLSKSVGEPKGKSCSCPPPQESGAGDRVHLPFSFWLLAAMAGGHCSLSG